MEGTEPEAVEETEGMATQSIPNGLPNAIAAIVQTCCLCHHAQRPYSTRALLHVLHVQNTLSKDADVDSRCRTMEDAMFGDNMKGLELLLSRRGED